MANPIFSRELIEDAVLWEPRFVIHSMNELVHGQQMEFERSIGIFSDELWEYDKKRDQVLRERMEQHVKELVHG